MTGEQKGICVLLAVVGLIILVGLLIEWFTDRPRRR